MVNQRVSVFWQPKRQSVTITQDVEQLSQAPAVGKWEWNATDGLVWQLLFAGAVLGAGREDRI